MWYFHIAVSLPGLGKYWYMEVTYLDDMQFMYFDSEAENPRMEPRAPWVERNGAGVLGTGDTDHQESRAD